MAMFHRTVVFTAIALFPLCVRHAAAGITIVGTNENGRQAVVKAGTLTTGSRAAGGVARTIFNFHPPVKLPGDPMPPNVNIPNNFVKVPGGPAQTITHTYPPP